MNDNQTLRTIEFIETIKERFDNEGLTAINIKNHVIKEDNEYLQYWLDVNKNDFELIGFEIRRTTKEERIQKIFDMNTRLRNELQLNKNKIKFLKIRNEEIYDKIGELSIKIYELRK